MGIKDEMMVALKVSNIADLMRALEVVFEKGKYKALGVYYDDFDAALNAAFSQPKYDAIRKVAVEKVEIDRKALEAKIAERKYSEIPEGVLQDYAASNVVMTTSYRFLTAEVQQEFSVVTADCVYGMNAVKDIFAGVRNLVGGRVASIERLLIDGKEEVTNMLKLKAFMAGGNALVAVTFGYQVIGDGASGAMIAICASGTAVKISRPS